MDNFFNNFLNKFLFFVIFPIFWIFIFGGIVYEAYKFFTPEEPENPPLVEEYVPGDNKVKDEVEIYSEPYTDPDYQYDKSNAFREEVEEDLKNERSGYSCNCSKTCDEIYTCEEAQYQLEVCGCYQRDGDDDGTACDNMCQY